MEVRLKDNLAPILLYYIPSHIAKSVLIVAGLLVSGELTHEVPQRVIYLIHLEYMEC